MKHRRFTGGSLVPSRRRRKRRLRRKKVLGETTGVYTQELRDFMDKK